ncbi:hypothetical protein ATZ36_12415 [Candidatus Endomicrobiellum trichonymphae]|uniref:Tr-type G domain-containing protein n=1 Tax=Endomicrobium trichonymphae TaxID=1408204 RepID=A0A1E5IMX0_ENDTX|nr:hypothetical protein ATZ36_12415 [Candidatus Endomicrobium trichonymphae]
MDAFVGPTELDFDMAKWLKEYNISFKIIANKCDKVSKNVPEDEIRSKAAECFGTDKSNVFTVSAKKRSGFSKLKTDILKFFSS